MIKQIDLDELIEKVQKANCEITITIEPDREEITVQPWKPFHYRCPYADE